MSDPSRRGLLAAAESGSTKGYSPELCNRDYRKQDPQDVAKTGLMKVVAQ